MLSSCAARRLPPPSMPPSMPPNMPAPPAAPVPSPAAAVPASGCVLRTSVTLFGFDSRGSGASLMSRSHGMLLLTSVNAQGMRVGTGPGLAECQECSRQGACPVQVINHGP
eukprot:scaffold118443_cov27-Tisochrysis_lutea.AAC.1